MNRLDQDLSGDQILAKKKKDLPGERDKHALMNLKLRCIYDL